MRTKFAGLVAAVALLGATFAFFNPLQFRPPASAKFHRAQAQTVLLKDKGGQASGVVVVRSNPEGKKRVFIWTAAHVVDKAPELDAIRIFHSDGHKSGYAVFKARCVSFSVKHDLALLLVDCPADFFTPATFGHKDAILGEHIFVVGNALGEMFDGSVTQGNVSQVGVRPASGWFWDCDLDQTTATIVPGNSGGPVYNDKGEVIGIAVGWARMPTIGVYVPLREIVSWAKDAGVIWAVRDYLCPPDDVLEKTITLTKKLLTPPPPPPAPPKTPFDEEDEERQEPHCQK